MYYGFGVQQKDVCVAVNDQTKTSLTGKKTKNFTSYHSFEFKETGMMAWRYFGIGEGVFISYVGTSFRPAGSEVTKPFIKTEQEKIQAQGKARKDRSLHIYSFVDEPGCAQIFEDQEKYELHCLRGIHDDQELQPNALVQDKIKNSYVSLIKISSPISTIMNVNQGSIYMDKRVGMTCAQYPVMEYMNKEGWALPVIRKVIVWVIHKRSEKQEEGNS